ncbi:MAG: hypothetical protein R3B69_04385 [Candidatus Paceibacterota bacterium]
MDQSHYGYAFAVTATIQDLDPSYQYCHVLGHELSAKETAKDPSRWKDVVARSPLGMCSNGGVHGAFQERFRVEHFDEDEDYTRIVPELEGVCKPREGWEPTRMGQATCVHALGHLTMYVTNADINKALELCDLLLADDQHGGEKQLCYDGAFMQIYQPLEPEDFALIEGKEIETKEESAEFCATFVDDKKLSCLMGRWPLFLETIETPATVSLICEPLRDDVDAYRFCHKGTFAAVTTLVAENDVERVELYCAAVPTEVQSWCFADAVARFLTTDITYTDRALAMCSAAVGYGVEHQCYKEIIRYMGFIFTPDDPDRTALCRALPPIYQTQCQ